MPSLNAAVGREIFFQFLYLIQSKALIQKPKPVDKFLSSVLFVYCSWPLICQSNTPFWQSNTAFGRLLISQSNGAFLSGYTIKKNIDSGTIFNQA